MEVNITIEEKREFIKNHGDYVTAWHEDNWVPKNSSPIVIDYGGIDTETLYNSLTYEEPDRIEYMKNGKIINIRNLKK